MNDAALQSVREMTATPLQDGESRTLKCPLEREGNEPEFYAVYTRGDYLYASPRWINAPALELLPRPPIAERAGISLLDVDEFQFEVREPTSLCDLYCCATGIWLVSDALLSVLERAQPNGVEHRTASLRTRSGEKIVSFNVVLPPVLDAVDTTKTDVTIARVIGGPLGYLNVVRFETGYVLNASIPP